MKIKKIKKIKSPSKNLILKSYHYLQDQSLILTSIDSDIKNSLRFNDDKRYSQRKRFPKLNSITGERLIYEYNKGVLIDTKAMTNINQEFIDHLYVLNSERPIKKKEDKVVKINNLNNKLVQSPKFAVKDINYFLTLPPLTEKYLIQNKFNDFFLKLTIINSDSKNVIIINKNRYLHISKGDYLIIPPKAFYSIKNLSSQHELVINIQINN